jgi:hypothetical protein
MSSSADDPAQCGFSGNPDIYGLGVRVGMYLSWAAPLISKTALPEAAVSAADALMIFQLAILVVIFVNSAVNPKIYEAEIFILIYSFFGGLGCYAITVTTPQKYAQSQAFSTSVGRIAIYTTSSLVMGGYSLWFLVKRNIFMPTPCGTFIYPQKQFAYVCLGGAGGLISFFVIAPTLLCGPDMYTVIESYLRHVFGGTGGKLSPRIRNIGDNLFGWYKRVIVSLTQQVRDDILAKRERRRRGVTPKGMILTEKRRKAQNM